ncbi:hypothetical protein [Stenotrophomonas koreensis]|uniref:hypothetical protein n=1 Tax=Stenotrophomonas koreensis TaxID=266128 RepID=UPI00070F0291|nr:hypothetical protein [Stenotrophomonas koreensis]
MSAGQGGGAPRTTSRAAVPASRRYWFRAKPSGLGWDLPLCWQGWGVYALALVAIVASFVLFPPNRQLVPFLAVHGGIVLVVLIACLWKGEPLRRG